MRSSLQAGDTAIASGADIGAPTSCLAIDVAGGIRSGRVVDVPLD